MRDNLDRKKKPLGVRKTGFIDLESYSFFQIGEAWKHDVTWPAKMACAAPMRLLDVGGKTPNNVLYVPPVSPTAGGNCENIPQKHVDLFFTPEDDVLHDEKERRDFLWGHYCHDCPVREACFEYAMSYIDDGIWAGTTGLERRDVRGRMQGEEPTELNARHQKIIDDGKKRLRNGEQPLNG